MSYSFFIFNFHIHDLFVCHQIYNRDKLRYTFLLLGLKSKMGIYLVLEVPINLCILKSHLDSLKQLLGMQIWNVGWYVGLQKLFKVQISGNYVFSLHNYFFLLQGNLEDAYSLYEQAIAIEKGKEHSQTLPMLYAQYSRFVYMVGWAT